MPWAVLCLGHEGIRNYYGVVVRQMLIRKKMCDLNMCGAASGMSMVSLIIDYFLIKIERQAEA